MTGWPASSKVRWSSYTTSNYKTSSYQTPSYITSRYITSSYKTSRIQNVQDTKRPGYETSIYQTLSYRTSRIQNVHLPDAQLLNIQDIDLPYRYTLYRATGQDKGKANYLNFKNDFVIFSLVLLIFYRSGIWIQLITDPAGSGSYPRHLCGQWEKEVK
jgi:hypothetical protein